MIRWLLIILFIYLVYRLIKGPKNRNRRRVRFHFGDLNNGGRTQNSPRTKQRLEEIEDAEFEDITDKVNKEDNS